MLKFSACHHGDDDEERLVGLRLPTPKAKIGLTTFIRTLNEDSRDYYFSVSIMRTHNAISLELSSQPSCLYD